MNFFSLQHFNTSQFSSNPSTSKTSPSSKTSFFKTKNHNNNNKKDKSKKSLNLQNSYAKDKHEQPHSSKLKSTTNQQHQSDLSYIVPVTDPLTAAASVATNSKSLRSWSQPKSKFASTSCGLETKHKYPNMDPNG